jgi:plastocyanin
MSRTSRLAIVWSLIVVFAAASALTVVAHNRRRHRDHGKKILVEVLDTCLPGDPGWNPTGGCTLDPDDGDVSFAEFGALLAAPTLATNTSPAGLALVGHPAWRNEPSHIVIKEGKTVHIENNGGRGHTFSEVKNFGGGFIAGLNFGQVMAEGCAPTQAVPLPPGGEEKIRNLAPGLHKFQCCIHPWMRATIRVEER